MRRRVLKPSPPVDINRTLHLFRRGPQDPTLRLGAREAWRATRTADGPATTHFLSEGDSVVVTAWGPGADQALALAPELLGLDNDPREFVAHHPVVKEAQRRSLGMRLGRTSMVCDALVASILEQKVHSSTAFNNYASLVRKFGQRAPGPRPMWIAPDPASIAALAYWQLHPLGIERKRATTIINACSYHRRLEEITAMAKEEAYGRLMALPGVGAWTAAEVARAALGDRDAVSLGDLHLPHVISWALAGEARSDDHRMLELLEPYLGHRTRAIRLIEVWGPSPPRFGPRTRPASIAQI